MSKNLTINGAAYNGISNVTIGSAIFRDADEVITIPTATKAINENGTNIDVLNYSKVNVNVPVGVQPSGTLVLNLSESIADRDCADYAKVTVNITKDASSPVLSSISAAYSGGSVSAGTTLTQLTGISITATYTMAGYTGNIIKSGITTGYTLSGNLTAGQTNTITVSYGGKTSTIQVPVAAEPLVLDKLVVTYDNSTPVEAGTALSALNEVVKAQYTNGTQTGALTENTDYELSGTLTAGQTNTITVTGKGTYAGLAAVTFSVTVKAAVVSVTGVSVSPTAKTITAGETFTITATISPSNATNKNVTWTSTAPSVASVTGNGLTATVNALTTGSATIKAVTADGSHEAACAVAVESVQNYSIDYNTGVEYNGKSISYVSLDPLPTETTGAVNLSLIPTQAATLKASLPEVYNTTRNVNTQTISQTNLGNSDYTTYNICSSSLINKTNGAVVATGENALSGTVNSDATVMCMPTIMFVGLGGATWHYGAGSYYFPYCTGAGADGVSTWATALSILYPLMEGYKYTFHTSTGNSASIRVILYDETLKVLQAYKGTIADTLVVTGKSSLSGSTASVPGSATIPAGAKYCAFFYSGVDGVTSTRAGAQAFGNSCSVKCEKI